jgi:predicted dehydrogenase
MSNQIGIGQVGVGYWGRNLLRNFAALDDARLAFACDRDRDVLDQVHSQHPDVPTTKQYGDLLEAADMDAVAVATETPEHYDLARRALEAGKHVFIEKPMTETAEQAEKLAALAEKRDRRLMVGHLLMYHPAFEHVKQLIDDGALGEVYYLYSMRVNLGIIRQRENALASLAPHDLAVACWLLSERPASVSASGQAYLQDGIEDVAFVTVRFEGNPLAHLHASWLDPHKTRKTTVVGSKQMAVIDDTENNEKVRLYDKGVDPAPGEARYADYADAMTLRSGDIRIPHIDMEEPLRRECAHFVESIRTGRTPRSGPRNGLAVTRLLEAAQQSLELGGASVSV